MEFEKMQKKIGQYLYFDGMLREKKFGDRSFTVLIAAAEDAGVIGPENNGIVVLDDNYRNVVLDQHMKINSGYFGPSDVQKAELEKVMAMDWDTFSHFVATHPRYRGITSDINAVSDPDAGDLLDLWISKGKVPNPTGDDIRTPEMIAGHEDDSVAYAYPDKTREEMIVALANHESYVPMNTWNRGFVISWDIKVRGKIDERAVEGYDLNSEMDERWEAYKEEHGDSLFSQACDDALRDYREGSYTTYGAEHLKSKFYANGRSGGHLVLSDWSGPSPRGWAACPMAFDDREDYIGWLKGLSDKSLVDFYALVKSVDVDTADPAKNLAHQYAFIRENLEDDWAAEAAPASH